MRIGFLIVILSLASTGVARAQAFPGDAAWTPFPCGEVAMFDPFQDQPGFLAYLDLVGEESVPAAYRAVDDDFLYLRMRLEQNPAEPNGDLMDFSWGFAFDLDGDFRNYELLVLASGANEMVQLFTNETTTMQNRLSDPADAPAVGTYPFADNGQTALGSLSEYGDDPDRFLDMAIPWADLEPLGLGPLTPMSVWAGSSMLMDGLDGDIACSEDSGSNGPMNAVLSGRTVADGMVDTDGDGFTDADEVQAGTDPADMGDAPDVDPAGPGRLEGGGGCSVGGGGNGRGSVLAALVMVFATSATRRRSGPRPGPGPG